MGKEFQEFQFYYYIFAEFSYLLVIETQSTKNNI
jgi:hypothetical protein